MAADLPPVLPRAGPPGEILLDYAALRATAIADLERFAGPDWTDFNSHDPGITILEALCYALTDFGYRLHHPMPDLLASPPGTTPPASVLRGPAENLSGRAVTPDDLRALAIDVPGVRNAWVEPALPGAYVPRYEPAAGRIVMAPADQLTADPTSGTVVAIAGLHRVLIEPDGSAPGGGATLAATVAARLHANRNLSEDFEEVRVLGTFDVRIALDVEIVGPASSAEVLAQIAARIDAYFSPVIPRLVLSPGVPPETIVDGPAPRNGGFLDRERLAVATRLRVVHRSVLIREVTAVDGVRAVRALDFLDAPAGAWSLPVPDLATPRLSRQGSRVRLFSPRAVTGIEFAFTTPAVAAPAATPLDLPLPVGRWRDVGAYRTIQEDLPVAYGVGPGTLPSAASPARRADSTRLRAYLAIFDQLLASYFARLETLPSLLSPLAGPAPQRSAVPDIRPAAGAPSIFAPGLSQADIDTMLGPSDPQTALQSRNRVLNHLLARFAEELPNDPLDARLIASKERVLAALPDLAAGRGAGVDLLAPPGDPSVDPPLIQHLLLDLDLDLDLDPGERLLLIEHVLLRPVAEDAVQTEPLLTFVARADPFSLQVTILLPSRLEATDASRILPLVRAAVPAHVVVWVRWLTPTAMRAATAAYDDWLAGRRSQLRQRFGLSGPD